MHTDTAIDMGREALLQALWIGGPILGIALITGLVIGVVQTMTQVQEQTVSLVPRMLVTLVALVLLLPWILSRLVDYFQSILLHING
ncbi:MAG: flagellar biosynthetic protein FliQ [Thermoguttaceae bacterium]|nr:flagellar biosynthetic protein FliQ [Thermoguttaceae bacterium]